jgi:anti-sigma factor RsiW
MQPTRPARSAAQRRQTRENLHKAVADIKDSNFPAPASREANGIGELSKAQFEAMLASVSSANRRSPGGVSVAGYRGAFPC